MIDHRLTVVITLHVAASSVLPGVMKTDGFRFPGRPVEAVDLHVFTLATVVASVSNVKASRGVAGNVFVITGGRGEGIDRNYFPFRVGCVHVRPIATIVVPNKMIPFNYKPGSLAHLTVQFNLFGEQAGAAAGAEQ